MRVRSRAVPGRKPLAGIVGAFALLVAIAVPALRVNAQAQPEWTPKPGLPLSDPVQVRSRNGVLRVELDARRRDIMVSGARIQAQPFNDRLIGPTLRVRPGDRIEATIRSATSATG